MVRAGALGGRAGSDFVVALHDAVFQYARYFDWYVPNGVGAVCYPEQVSPPEVRMTPSSVVAYIEKSG
ncbi:hypothetical protein D3C85_1804030 [compost metagenome]